ncbi:MAG: site-specific integrase, partial [Lactobacillus delbrueckii]
MPKRNPAIKKYVSRGQTKYKFQAYLGQDENGKSINTTRSGFDSYAQASSAFNRLKAQGLAAKAPKKATIEEVWSLWFDSYKGGVKESTASKTLTSYR